MAVASGYAVLPVSASLIGITEELRQGLVGPTQKAAKQSGAAIRKEMADGVGKASKDVEKAHFRIKKAAEEQTTAESKLSEQKLKTEAANKAVEAAARKRAEAESKGIDAVEKAEQELLKKRAAAEREARNLAAAEGQVEKALSESARAAQSLKDRQDALARATEAGGTESKKFRDRLREMGDEAETTGGLFEGMGGKIAGWAGGLAGVMGVGAFAGMGQALASETALINMQLGYTGAAAEGVGESIKQALSSGVAGSAEEAANAIGALESQWKYLGTEGEQTAGELADNFMAFARVMEVDVAEATQTAGQLVLNGLAPDIESAADLMTTAMQRVPMQMRDEIPEIINEYGVHFAGLGLSGEEAFSMLVSASERGKWALDKTGDSLKEFQIRASDGSKATMDAYEAIGIVGDEAEAMGISVAAGGDSARIALELTAEKLLEIEDPAVRAQNAVALFGTPIEDLSIDQIPQFLESLTGMENHMAGAEGASQALADTMANSLDGRLNRLKGTVTSLAGDAFMWVWELLEDDLIPAFKDLGSWIQDNEAWLGSLAVAVGSAAGAWALWTGAVKGWQAVTKMATAVQVAFNAVMAANPIMLAAMAVAALAAGLTYFFTQTETGQALWEKFTGAIADGWDWVTEKVGAGWNWLQETVFTPLMDFVTGTLQPIWESVVGGISDAWDGLVSGVQSAWENIFKPVLDGIWQVVQTTLGVIGTVILAPLLLAWEALSTGIQWYWDTVLQPVWSAIASFATETLWPILQSAFQWIGDKWQALSDGFGVVWAWIRDTVFAPLAAFVTETLWPALQSAFQWIGDKWQALSDALGVAWGWIRDNVFTKFEEVVAHVSFWFEEKIWTIQNRWDLLKAVLGAGWDWIRDNVFAKFTDTVGSVKERFDGFVDALGSKWEGLKSLLAKPINFMINTVYNDGILRAWNIIAGILPGLDKGDPLAGIPEHATGGRIIGPGTGTSDDVLMWGSNGEHMLTAREVQEMGGHNAVYAMRDAVNSGRPFTFDGKGGLAILPKTDERAGDLAGAAPNLLIPGYAEGGAIRPMWEIQLENGHRAAKMRHGNPYTWGHEDCSGYMSMIADAIINGGDGVRKWATSTFPGGQPWVPGLGPGFSVGVHDNPGGPGGGHTAGTLTGVGPYMTTNVESGGYPSLVKYGIGAAGADDPQFRGVHPGQFHLAIGADGAFESGGSVDPGVMRGWISEKLGGVIDTIMDPLVSLLPSPPPQWQGIPRGVYDTGRDKMVEGIADGVAGLTDGLATVWNAVRNIPDLIRDALDGDDDINEAAAEGYHKGGLAPAGRGFMAKTAIEPEMVLNPAMTRAFIDWMNVSPESASVMAREIRDAFNGGDWGYGELAATLGSPEVAKAIVDGAAALGEISRELGPVAGDASRGFFEAQATSLLDVVGLGGLVPLASGWVDDHGPAVMESARSLMSGDVTATAGLTPGGVSIVIEAESDEDLVRVGQLKQLADRVHGIDVQVNTKKRPPAGMVTRGGPM